MGNISKCIFQLDIGSSVRPCNIASAYMYMYACVAHSVQSLRNTC